MAITQVYTACKWRWRSYDSDMRPICKLSIPMHLVGLRSYPLVSSTKIPPFCVTLRGSCKEAGALTNTTNHSYFFPSATFLRAATVALYKTSLKANKNAAVMTLWVTFGPMPGMRVRNKILISMVRRSYLRTGQSILPP